MTKYESKPVKIDLPVCEVYSRISNLESFQSRLDELPADVRGKIGEVKFTSDSIVINTPGMGNVSLNIVERIDNQRVALQANNAPIKLLMSINLKAVEASSTEVVTAIEVDIPVMLKPMVGPKLQEAADKFGEMISNLVKI